MRAPNYSWLSQAATDLLREYEVEALGGGFGSGDSLEQAKRLADLLIKERPDAAKMLDPDRQCYAEILTCPGCGCTFCECHNWWSACGEKGFCSPQCAMNKHGYDCFFEIGV